MREPYNLGKGWVGLDYAKGLLRIPANDRHGLGWGGVIARTPIVFAVSGEVFFRNLLFSRESIAPAHGEIMADRLASRLWGCGQTAFPALAVLYRSRSLRVDLLALGIIRSDRFECLGYGEKPAENNPKR